MARYTSPPGTFEPLRKELLEDPELTDAEARLIIYLVTKPAGWELNPVQLREALGRSPNWVKTTLAALRKRGLVVDGAKVHDRATGQFSQRPSRFLRERVVASRAEMRRYRRQPPQAEIPPLGPTSQNTVNGQVTPEAGIPPQAPTSPDGTFAQVTPEVDSPAPGKTADTREDGHLSEDGKAKTVQATGAVRPAPEPPGRSLGPKTRPSERSHAHTRDTDRYADTRDVAPTPGRQRQGPGP
jgi:hypothetical protein